MRRAISVFFHDRSRETKPASFFESTIKTLGAIAGTVVIFSTLLSSCGFLLLRSHSKLLGLSNFLEPSVTDYLFEGGGFASYTAFSVVELFVRHMWLPLIAVALFYFARFVTRRFRQAKRLSDEDRGPAPTKPLLIIWTYLILSTVAILFLTYKALPTVAPKDLLFTSGNPDERLKRTDARLNEMESDYLHALLYLVLSGAILLVVHSIVKAAEPNDIVPAVDPGEEASEGKPFHPVRSRKSRALTAGRVVISVLVGFQLLLLPMIYGQTVYPNNFHKVVLVEGEALKGIPQSDGVWLIKESPEYFVLYFRDEYTLRLIRKEKVTTLTLGARENIFNR